MGMIPVFVVIAGFILLWGMVNYHSFRAKKKGIADTLDACMAAQLRLRDKVTNLLAFWQSQHLSLPPALLRLPDWTVLQPKNTLEAITSALDEVRENAQAFPHIRTDAAYQQHIAAYEEAWQVYRLARKKYRAATLAYNAEATHMPSKIIAKLFGFRPVMG